MSDDSNNDSAAKEAKGFERYLALRAALFDDVIQACDHIGEGDNPDMPVLCYQHRGNGITCLRCFVAHVELDHVAENLPRMRCDQCEVLLPPLDVLDRTNLIAWTRRSVLWALYVSDTVTAVTPRKHDNIAVKHISYAGGTIIAFEHMLCFECRAAVTALVALGSAM